MILWRIVEKKFRHLSPFDCTRLRTLGGRWSPVDTELIYAATSKSAAVLNWSRYTEGPYNLLEQGCLALPIVVPDSVASQHIEPPEYLFALQNGDPLINRLSMNQVLVQQWIADDKFAVVFFPSDAIYGEDIALINPHHKDFTKIIPGPLESIYWSDEPFLPRKIMDLDGHKDVFLCHSSKDKTLIVDPLYRALFAAGVSAWYDRAEIGWGHRITEKVQEGLSNSDYVIVILTENFLDSNFAKGELGSILNRELSTGQTRLLPLISGTDAFRKGVLDQFPLMRDKLHVVWKGDPDAIASLVRDRLTSAKGR